MNVNLLLIVFYNNVTENLLSSYKIGNLNSQNKLSNLFKREALLFNRTVFHKKENDNNSKKRSKILSNNSDDSNDGQSKKQSLSGNSLKKN